jgi:hypothetical protein
MRSLFIILIFINQLAAMDGGNDILALEKRLTEQEKRLELSNRDTIFSLGGRVQFDTVLNSPSVNASGGTNTYDYYMMPQSFTDNGKIPKLSSNVRSSRLWFKTKRETEIGTLRSLIEVDFWGSSGNEKVSNSHNSRLRHAYININEWTVGQTTSTFMGNSLPDLIILSSDVAFIRQAQLRYSISYDHLFIDLAFENPETTLVPDDTNKSTSYNDDIFFDTVARVRYENKNIKASFATLLREISIEKNNKRSVAIAWGVNSSLKYLFENNDYLQASYTTGDGLGRYISLGHFSAGEYTDDTIHLLNVSSAHLSYTHRVSLKLRGTLLLSQVQSHADSNIVVTDVSNTKAFHMNLRYMPFTQALISIEYIYGKKEYESAASQSLHRLMLSMSYIF